MGNRWDGRQYRDPAALAAKYPSPSYGSGPVYTMTSTIDIIQPTTDPLEMTATYVHALNSGDAEAVLGLYAENAVSVWEPGQPISGEEHAAKVREYVARKPTMRAEIRESYVTGDTALLVVDWEMDVPATDGAEAEHHTGIGLDVLRKGPDGRWRYVVDNPFGDA